MEVVLVLLEGYGLIIYFLWEGGVVGAEEDELEEALAQKASGDLMIQDRLMHHHNRHHHGLQFVRSTSRPSALLPVGHHSPSTSS